MSDARFRELDRRYQAEPTLENAQTLDAEVRRQGQISEPRLDILSRLLYAVKNMPTTLRFTWSEQTSREQRIVERVHLNGVTLIPAIDPILLDLDTLNLTDRQKVERLTHGDYVWEIVPGEAKLTLFSHLAILPEDELVVEALQTGPPSRWVLFREGTIQQLQEHQRLLGRMTRVRVNPDYYGLVTINGLDPRPLDPGRFGGLRDEVRDER